MAGTSTTDLAGYEAIGYGGGKGSLQRGAARFIISDAVATRTLLAKESGALCCFDRAAGVVYTLPTPVIGLQYEFFVTVSVTSNAHKIVTAAVASQFLLGEVFMYSTATASGAGFAANGTTIAALSANGSTTGGLIGERYIVTAISTTQWVIHGVQVGSGTLATAFATS
jgi:hypothetical protein